MGSPQQGLSKWSNVLHTVVVTATRPSPTSGRSRPLVARSPFTTCPRSTAHQSAATATLPSRESQVSVEVFFVVPQPQAVAHPSVAEVHVIVAPSAAPTNVHFVQAPEAKK